MNRLVMGCLCAVTAAAIRRAAAAPLAADAAPSTGDYMSNAATLTVFNLTEYPTARCLDGTGAGFYYRAGAGADADKWLIMLEGGGFCSGVCGDRAWLGLPREQRHRCRTCG